MKAFILLSAIMAMATSKALVQIKDTTQDEWCQAGEYLANDTEHRISICKPCPNLHYMDKPNNETSCYKCSCRLTEICDRITGKCHCPPGKVWIGIAGDTGLCKDKVTPSLVSEEVTTLSEQNSTTPVSYIKPSSNTRPTTEKTPSTTRMDSMSGEVTTVSEHDSTTPAPNIKPSSNTRPTTEKTPSTTRMNSDGEQRLKGFSGAAFWPFAGLIAGLIAGGLFFVFTCIGVYCYKKQGGDGKGTKDIEEGDTKSSVPLIPEQVNEVKEDSLETTNEELDNRDMGDTASL